MIDYHQPNLSEVKTGFKHAQDRCLLLLDQSKQLLSNQSLNGSVILAVFALEELGKMIILSDRHNESKKASKSFIRIKKRRQNGIKKKRQKGALDDFYNHVCKQQKALLILPKDIEIIYQEFKEPDFDSKCFETKAILIDQDLRERFTFIDYGDTGWIDPPKVNKKLLEKFIDEVETHCKKLSI